MNVTIKDVAREANVSVATVSRVLNKKTNVSAEAISAVNTAVKKLGYSVNLMARDLRGGSTRRILAVVSSISRAFYAETLAGMEEVANANGYTVVIVTNNDSARLELEHLELLFSHAVDGVVLLAPKLDANTLSELCGQHNIALCLERLDGCNALTVTIDSVRAGRDAVDYLIRKGHKTIGMISTESRAQSSVDREEGYRQSLEAHKLAFSRDYIYPGGYDYESGVKGCVHLLGLNPAPTAIFCISDLIAIGAVNAAAELGYRVGRNIMFVGFDNAFFSRVFKPHLSTVEQPYVLQGKTVMEKLIGNIKQPNRQDCGLYTLPHRLILRETTGD
jgi:LacI family transcriptional regulator/LacI family repressor for deo operon, udp, cdd, tsx, nupC, and nupG